MFYFRKAVTLKFSRSSFNVASGLNFVHDLFSPHRTCRLISCNSITMSNCEFSELLPLCIDSWITWNESEGNMLIRRNLIRRKLRLTGSRYYTKSAKAWQCEGHGELIYELVVENQNNSWSHRVGTLIWLKYKLISLLLGDDKGFFVHSRDKQLELIHMTILGWMT